MNYAILDDIYYIFCMYYHEEYLKALSYKDKDPLILEYLQKKFIHTFRVIDNTSYICFYEKVSKEITLLSQIAALFHDIGRFEQIIKHCSFNDNTTFDHGNFSAQIFNSYKDKLLPFFNENQLLQIENAIKYHNKYRIPKHLDETSTLLCKIVRDADKLDIITIDLTQELNFGNEYLLKDEFISNECLKEFNSKQSISYKNIKTIYDNKIHLVSWIYDLNFKSSFNLLKSQKFIEYLCDTSNINNSNLIELLENVKISALKDLNHLLK